ncbi:MAG: hypothetical protein IKK80_00180 [Treponema sp.]|nr:hypothetical protein [Treponema sp.]
MKRFLFCLILAFFTFLCISCNLQIEERTSTSLLIPASVFKAVSDSPQQTAPQTRLNVYLTCGKESITERHILTEEELNNGLRLKFDNLPVGNTGHLYVEFANIKCNGNQGENTKFYANDVAIHLGETSFEVIPNGEVYIKLELKPAKEYIAQFNFIDEYSEYSNVELDFTERSTIKTNLPVGTTKWTIKNEGNLYFGRFGEQIYAKELLNYFQNENNLTLKPTGELPENIKTPIVYCEKDPNEKEYPYTYKILGSGNSVLTTSAEITDYCFDNAGNFYFIDEYCPVYKIAYNHKENEYEDFTFTNQGSFYNAARSSQITYDKAQNYLYIYGSQPTPGSASTYIHRIQNPAGAIYKDKKVEDPESFWNEDPLVQEENIDIFGSISFTVHKGILYVSKIQRTAQDYYDIKNNYSLVLQKGSIETGIFEDITIEYKILSDAQNGLSGTTDIMFQDGSLYIIFSCSNNNWAGNEGENIYYNYSTGGIVKYNTESERFDGSFGIKGFAQIKTLTGSEGATLNFYAPTSGNNGTESKYFYGPKQFVAIMPKKLVFLDSGADVSSYDASLYPDNPSKIPSKSRIVEYDLSTNSFSSAKITGTDLGFGFSGFSM